MPLMDPGDGPSDADPPAVPVAVNELGERDLDRELERLLADHVVIGAVPDTKERLERLADELFALLRHACREQPRCHPLELRAQSGGTPYHYRFRYLRLLRLRTPNLRPRHAAAAAAASATAAGQ